MNEGEKRTDDVAGPARDAEPPAGEPSDAMDRTLPLLDEDPTLTDEDPTVADPRPDPAAAADPPPAVAELAAACVRFVATRYGIHLDFMPETLSVLDQWVRDARAEVPERPELVELVQSSAGAYLGEVVRRAFGATWLVEGEHSEWRLGMATVYCAFNPVGLVREALMLGEAEGWHAHFELDPGEREAIEARLAALPEVSEDEFYAPSTRFDVVNVVVDALRETMRSSGLGDVRFEAADYAGV
jgi:hypothetical protein